MKTTSTTERQAETAGERGNPRVAVILLNWKGWADTIECLESVFRQEHANLQAIVCDNASPDDSLARIASWASGALPAGDTGPASLRHLVTPPVPKPIEHLELDRAAAEAGGGPEARRVPLVLIQTGGNLGFAGGNNVGLRYVLAQGGADYVWLLNNDTVVDSRALAALVEMAESDPRVGMVGSKVLDHQEPHLIQAIGGGTVSAWKGFTRHLGAHEADVSQWETPLEPGYITGASLLVRTSAARQIGEMDERYFLYSEEVDWCMRARRAGWRLMYSPGSQVWHKGGSSVVYQTPLHDYHTVRSSLLWVRKFYPALLPLAFAHSFYRCLAPKVVRLQPERLRAVLRAYRDFFSGRGSFGAPSRGGR